MHTSSERNSIYEDMVGLGHSVATNTKLGKLQAYRHDAAAFEVVDAVAVVRTGYPGGFLVEQCVCRVLLARAGQALGCRVCVTDVLVVPARRHARTGA